MAPPDDYGWAYIDPQRASASADGPEDSVQFRYGSGDLSPGQFSGSQDFTFLSNDMINQGGVGSGSQLFVTGNVYVSGTIYADTYTIKEITSFQIDHSGSTTFGDSADDTHQRTGSLEVSGWAILASNLDVSGTVGPLTSSGEILARNFIGNSISVSGSTILGSAADRGTTTFYNTITGAVGPDDQGGGDIHANKVIVNDLYVSGSTTGVSINLGDDETATWGDANDLTIVHDGSNTTMTNDTGHFIINSNSTVGKLILKTGTNTSATQVNFLDNSGATLFGTTGAGNTFFGTGTSTSDHAITGTLCVSGLEHQVTGTLEVSGKANLSGDTQVLGSVSGSSTLGILGTASFGAPVNFSGDLTFNVAAVDGRVDFMIEDGSGPESALQLRKNGRVTKIGHDTPSNGQVLTWDGTSGWVEWGDGVIGISGSDVHYSSTEIRTSGPLNVTGSSMLAGDVTTTGSMYATDGYSRTNDTDTGYTFLGTDCAVIKAGNVEMGRYWHQPAGQDYISFNSQYEDVEFRIGYDSGVSFLVEGDTGYVGVQKRIFSTTDADTYIDFDNTDQIDFYAGAVKMLTLDEQAVGPDNVTVPSGVQFTASGDLCAAEKIVHVADPDTYFKFHSADWIKTYVGGAEALSIKEAVGGNHFSVGSGFCLTASDGIAVDRSIYHKDDFDTSIEFTADQIDFVCGGVTMMTLDETTTDSIHFFEGSGSGGASTYSSGNFKIDGDLWLGGGDLRNPVGNTCISFGTDDNIDYLAPITSDVTIQTSTTAQLKLVSENGQASVDLYGDGSTLADGDNIGAIRFYGTEDDGTANSTLTAVIVAEARTASWAHGGLIPTRMRFAVGGASAATIQADDYVLTLDNGHGLGAGATVGIGTNAPIYKLDVQVDQSSTYVAQFRQHHSSGDGVRIRSAASSGGRYITFSDDAGSNKGHVTVNSNTVTYGAFTGYHPAALPAADHDTGYEYGTIVKISSVASDQKAVSYSVEKTTAAQDKAVLGIHAGKMDEMFNDDGTPDRESEKHQIFALGDGHVLVCSENGDIETGDFICSSNTAGHGMKQADDLMHSYTVAKSSESVDWATEGASTKLVACTYHAG